MRTQSLATFSTVLCPRATSKSEENRGWRGIVASAAAISFCAGSVGVQTFSTLTFTGGFWFDGVVCCALAAAVRPSIAIVRTVSFTARIVNDGRSAVTCLNSVLGTILLMANLTLVYGLRLLPADEIVEVGEAPVKLKNGREAHVTMHVLEGSKDDIEKQLRTSLSAFFDFYPEI